MWQKLAYNIDIAASAIVQNRLRALLTSLGIIFGVASVVSMMAVGRGARIAIVEQMKVLGANNIIIQPVLSEYGAEPVAEDSKAGAADAESISKWSPGLTNSDVEAIREGVPMVEEIGSEIIIENSIVHNGRKANAKLIGVNEGFFRIHNILLESGNHFGEEHFRKAIPACIIGNGIKSRFFPSENPLGRQIKVGNQWLTIAGVAKSRKSLFGDIGGVAIRDYDLDVYAPIATVLMRYENRLLQHSKPADESARWMWSGDESEDVPDPNYHQIDQVTVRMEGGANLPAAAAIIERMMKRRHNSADDFRVIVPEVLLKQKQEAESLFNIMLTSIASISLLVGGIGIMNIMLASVLERIKEIGVRLSLGATRQDIVMQFLSEATAISVSGGIIGIFLGFLFSYLIEKFFDYPTSISASSVVISFAVALAVGLVFGIVPARRAAELDPVESLRYE